MQENKQISLGGITDLQGAKEVARRMMANYDKNSKGFVDPNEVGTMMIDAYHSINKGFNPSQADIETYSKVLDKNSDGKITLEDLEALAIKYLVGDVRKS